MNQTALAELQKKAPLVPIDELSTMIETELLPSGICSKVDSVWLSGSFVNPHKEIDRGSNLSDLDLFIVVPEWNLSPATTSIAIFASQVPIPSSFERLSQEEDWDKYGGSVWECSADEAWEALPDPVQAMLRRSLRKRFYRNERELEQNISRNYDLFMGSQRQIKIQAEKTNAAVACICEPKNGRTVSSL